jgi:hypothetical protein
MKNPLMLRIISYMAKDIIKLKSFNRYSIYELFIKDWFLQNELKQ